METNLVTVLLGPPASGKSTVFKKLKMLYPAIGHFAVRLFFENERQKNSLWSTRAVPDERGWLPDKVVAEAAEVHIQKYIKRKEPMIIEGFPASKEQAQLLNKIMYRNQITLSRVIYLSLDSDTSKKRAMKRQVCKVCDSGVNHVESNGLDYCPVCLTPLTRREDDEGHRFIQRLDIHHHNIQDVLSTLNIPVVEISGSQSEDAVFEQVLKNLG
ncbi:adenylate kinase [compost metagenome]